MRQRANKVHAYGYTFDSQPEFLRYVDLLALQTDGVITGLQVHPYFLLKPRIVVKANGVHNGFVQAAESYTADFMYQLGDKVVVEDVKAITRKGTKRTLKPLVKTPARNKHKALIELWCERNRLSTHSLIMVGAYCGEWLYFDTNHNQIVDFGKQLIAQDKAA